MLKDITNRSKITGLGLYLVVEHLTCIQDALCLTLIPRRQGGDEGRREGRDGGVREGRKQRRVKASEL